MAKHAIEADQADFVSCMRIKKITSYTRDLNYTLVSIAQPKSKRELQKRCEHA